MKAIPDFPKRYWLAVEAIEEEHAKAGHPFQRVKSKEIASKLGLGHSAFYEYVKNGVPPRPQLVAVNDQDEAEAEAQAS